MTVGCTVTNSVPGRSERYDLVPHNVFEIATQRCEAERLTDWPTRCCWYHGSELLTFQCSPLTALHLGQNGWLLLVGRGKNIEENLKVVPGSGPQNLPPGKG